MGIYELMGGLVLDPVEIFHDALIAELALVHSLMMVRGEQAIKVDSFYQFYAFL